MLYWNKLNKTDTTWNRLGPRVRVHFSFGRLGDQPMYTSPMPPLPVHFRTKGTALYTDTGRSTVHLVIVNAEHFTLQM